jgi:integrase
MPVNIRPRGRKGTSFEVRIIHPLLPQPAYKTVSSQAQAEELGARCLALLNEGVIPDWLQRGRTSETPTVAQAIRTYLSATAVSGSTEDILTILIRQVGSVPLESINWDWIDRWIGDLKLVHRLAPGTIRKRKGALSAVLDHVCRTNPQWMSSNPLKLLPKGYSGYGGNARETLAREGIAIPRDVMRERRIDAPEEAAIIAVLRKRIEEPESDLAARAKGEGLLLMFQLALETAMRMREIYTLTLEQIDVGRRTIFLKKTKNGTSRHVPLTRTAVELLNKRWPALEEVRQGNRLFPFWNGSLDREELNETSALVSRMFRQVFREAGCRDLHFHDTRHEGVCRWVIKSPNITDSFLARAAGMTDARTRARYLSLRGWELAEKLDF